MNHYDDMSSNMLNSQHNYGKVKLVIEDMHSYSVPEIIALPIVDCSEDYLKWLVKETES